MKPMLGSLWTIAGIILERLYSIVVSNNSQKKDETVAN